MIEEAIAKLTAAMNRNNELLEAVLASAGTAPAPAAETTESKPAKEKKSKPAVEVKTKLEVVEPEAPEEEESGAPEAPTFTIIEALEASKKVLAADRDKNKPLLAAIREKFGVETVKDLAPDQIGPYMAELAKLEA